MKRSVDINEISDGRLYGSNDMVKADCGACDGCHACCQGMGQSIVLDPLDVFRLMVGLECDISVLLEDKVEWNVVDGIILPNIKMAGSNEACAFLSDGGRCTVHELRPGICRLFPLGRYYENHSFHYFLQIGECRKERLSKIKVWKWVDTPDLIRYEDFVLKWHYFLNDMETLVARLEEADQKNLNFYLLNQFYVRPYGPDDFYAQFEVRLAEANEFLASAHAY